MDPAEALERIASLLERGREPAYRVRAFRNAAATVRDVDPDDLRRRAETGRLRELPGIGDTTARVVSEALAGETPAYLRRLEGDLDTATNPAAEAIRAELRGDCHAHSDWSDGGATIAEMAIAARDLGHDYLVLTDHSPRLKVARGLTPDRLRAQLDEVAALNESLAPFRLLSGMEVDILDDGALDLEDDLLARLDVVVASVHSKLGMERDAMTRRMVRAMTNPHADILGHCTGRLLVGRGRPQSQFDAETVFGACAAHGKAVEINCRPERLDPPRALLRLAVTLGCRIAIDTDAHAPGQLAWQPYGCARATECGVPLDSIVNTRTADGLVAWARAHAA